MHPDESTEAIEVLTSDGRPAHIRTVAAGDRDALLALHEGLDPDTQHLRFFAASKTAGQHYVNHVIAHHPETVASLVATVSGALVGLATAERVSDDTAEIAFLVAGAERGHGLGTLLLERLASVCEQRGIRHLVADVLPENVRMIQVLRDAGYTIERHSEPGLLVFDMSTEASQSSRSATAARKDAAEARSRKHILSRPGDQ